MQDDFPEKQFHFIAAEIFKILPSAGPPQKFYNVQGYQPVQGSAEVDRAKILTSSSLANHATQRFFNSVNWN